MRRRTKRTPGWARSLRSRILGEPIRVKSLEIPVTGHCNLRCAACDHGSPLLDKSFLDLGQLARDLAVLEHAMRADEFKLVGGEPLQHPDLLAIIETIRDSGIAESITLVTNGVLLGKAPAALWRSIDRLWLSIYPGVSLGLPLKEIEARCRDHGIRFDPRPTDEFRVVLLNSPIEDADLVQAIYRDCKTAHVWRCYTVLNGYFYKCSKSAVMRERLDRLGIPHDPDAVDGVDLRSTRRLRSRLTAYLKSKEPLDSCRFCLGTSGPMIQHRQLNARAVQAAMHEDHRPLIQRMRQEIKRSVRSDRVHVTGRQRIASGNASANVLHNK